MKLYSYFRSSASYRVRIALNLKELTAEIVPVNLLSGEQKNSDYMAVNSQQLLPSLVTDEGPILTQSLAIIEYLEETFPTPALLPHSAVERARVRALSLAIACEIAPLNNLSILHYLKDVLHVTDEQKNAWIAQWISKGLSAVEKMLHHASTGVCCHGNSPTLADCVLVPQLFNARRFKVDLSPFPTVIKIGEYLETLPAFASAHPDKQPDAL